MRKPAPAARPRSRATPKPPAAPPVQSETEFHLQAARLLRLGVPPGAGLWFHVPNQGKRSVVTGQLFKSMGMLPGMTDIVLVAAITMSYRGGPPIDVAPVGFLELKTGTGKLRPDQIEFRNHCEALRIPWGLARNLAEVEAFAREFYATFGLKFRATAQ